MFFAQIFFVKNLVIFGYYSENYKIACEFFYLILNKKYGTMIYEYEVL